METSAYPRFISMTLIRVYSYNSIIYNSRYDMVSYSGSAGFGLLRPPRPVFSDVL